MLDHQDMITRLSRPAPTEWVLARAAALLNPYYEKETPHGIRKIEAEDWADALADFPQWAIQKAAQWWKSDANPDRRKRPLEGDIASRAKVEMGPVKAAEIRIRRSRMEQRHSSQDAKAPRVTPEQMEAIMKEKGFNPNASAAKAFPETPKLPESERRAIEEARRVI